MSDQDTVETAKATPPYVSFATFKTLLKNFQEHGIPGRIDRSVFPSFSGSVAGQLIPGMRFLGLMDSNNRPTGTLKTLVATHGTGDWAEVLRVAIKDAYSTLNNLDLQTASPHQFNEAFNNAYPGAENVVRKCKTFFLAACTEAGIPISPYIMRNKKPRSGPAKKRQPKQPNIASEKQGKPLRDLVEPTAPLMQQTLPQQLLAVLDMDKMEEAEVEAVWTLLKYLRKEGK